MKMLLARIRLQIPDSFDSHYEAIKSGFEAGRLTVPLLPISDIQLARVVSEFTGMMPNDASIALLNDRLHMKRW